MSMCVRIDLSAIEHQQHAEWPGEDARRRPSDQSDARLQGPENRAHEGAVPYICSTSTW